MTRLLSLFRRELLLTEDMLCPLYRGINAALAERKALRQSGYARLYKRRQG